MARETKAERLAREHAEREEREATAMAHYFPRLMAALARATNEYYFELTVKEGMFKLVDRNSSDTYVLSPTWTREAWELDNLESELASLDRERAEQARLTEVRRQAFAKLSDEEKQALGLNDRNNW